MRKLLFIILTILLFEIAITSEVIASYESFIAPWFLSSEGDKLIVVVRGKSAEDDLVVVDLVKKTECFRLSKIQPSDGKQESIVKERNIRTASFCGELSDQIIYTMENFKEPWVTTVVKITSLSAPYGIKTIFLDKQLDPLIGASSRKLYYVAPSEVSPNKMELVSLDIYTGATKIVVKDLPWSYRLQHIYTNKQDSFLIYKRDDAVYKLDLQKGSSQKLFDNKDIKEKYVEIHFKLFGKRIERDKLFKSSDNLFLAQDLVMTSDGGNLFFSNFISAGENTLKQVYRYDLLQNKLDYLCSIPAAARYTVSPKGDYVIFFVDKPTSFSCQLYSAKGRFSLPLNQNELVLYDVKKHQIRKIDNFNPQRARLSITWWTPYQDKVLILKTDDLSLWVLDITTYKVDKLLNISY